ncbi:hypothetical protein LO763_22695 [Glycomyces sp. A-F 0318]|uniref:hypothetical protein n=1 Tax=Glycomyces amatae TaxID=2881355 RepID=UPI001E425A05|nr:hypothetical protein [Glycomyces amatae]MCD0446429.1 hypothetical protein [Glycomyces amatae]
MAAPGSWVYVLAPTRVDIIAADRDTTTGATRTAPATWCTMAHANAAATLTAANHDRHLLLS